MGVSREREALIVFAGYDEASEEKSLHDESAAITAVAQALVESYQFKPKNIHILTNTLNQHDKYILQISDVKYKSCTKNNFIQHIKNTLHLKNHNHLTVLFFGRSYTALHYPEDHQSTITSGICFPQFFQEDENLLEKQKHVMFREELHELFSYAHPAMEIFLYLACELVAPSSTLLMLPLDGKRYRPKKSILGQEDNVTESRKESAFQVQKPLLPRVLKKLPKLRHPPRKLISVIGKGLANPLFPIDTSYTGVPRVKSGLLYDMPIGDVKSENFDKDSMMPLSIAVLLFALHELGTFPPSLRPQTSFFDAILYSYSIFRIAAVPMALPTAERNNNNLLPRFPVITWLKDCPDPSTTRIFALPEPAKLLGTDHFRPLPALTQATIESILTSIHPEENKINTHDHVHDRNSRYRVFVGNRRFLKPIPAFPTQADIELEHERINSDYVQARALQLQQLRDQPRDYGIQEEEYRRKIHGESLIESETYPSSRNKGSHNSNGNGPRKSIFQGGRHLTETERDRAENLDKLWAATELLGRRLNVGISGILDGEKNGASPPRGGLGGGMEFGSTLVGRRLPLGSVGVYDEDPGYIRLNKSQWEDPEELVQAMHSSGKVIALSYPDTSD